MDIWRKIIPGRRKDKHGGSEAGECPHVEEEQGGPWARAGGQTDWVSQERGRGLVRVVGREPVIRADGSFQSVLCGGSC